jgi:hypothetical protein
MHALTLHLQTVADPAEECACDSCAAPLTVACVALIDSGRGTVYCSEACAEEHSPGRDDGR